MEFYFIEENEIKEFLSDKNLNLVESKRLLNKIALVRLYIYVDKCIFKQLNRDFLINPYSAEEIEAVNDYLKPIVLTLLELEHINFNGVNIYNAGNKVINTDHTIGVKDTEEKRLTDLLYKDLNGLKEGLNTFLCNNLNAFPCYADKCFGCGCDGGFKGERLDFY